MTKTSKNLDEDEIVLQRLSRYVLSTTGHMIWKIRMLSSLSHNEINMRSSINSGTEWRLEHMSNCHILTYAKALFQHFKALKCTFMLHNFYYQIYTAIHEGKTVVMNQVNSEDLYKYDPKQILFQQDSNDKEEQLRRIIQEQKMLRISGKLVEQNSEKRRKKKKQDKKNCIKKKKLS